MKRFSVILALFVGVMVIAGANGCSSDPNVEGAKLDLRNKDYDRALENLETALAANPDNTEALKLKGDVLSAKAETVSDVDEHSALVDEMIEAYNRAAELGVDVSGGLTMAYVREFDLGSKAFNRGRDDRDEYHAAAAYFNNATKIFPDSTGPYVNQAYSLINAGETTGAIEPFEAAIERGDDDPQTYIFLADLYRQNDRANEAVSLLETASNMFPDNVDIQAQLLNAYQASGQVDRAMQKYEEAVARDPNNKLYQYNYGSMLLQEERYDEAVEHLSEAVELDPEYSNAYYNLGAAYINKAVMFSEELNVIDDELRENRDDLSAAEVSAKESEMEELAEARRESFSSAIVPLERAKELTEAGEGQDLTGICQALFSAYVQTNQEEKAKTVQACAGYEEM